MEGRIYFKNYQKIFYPKNCSTSFRMLILMLYLFDIFQITDQIIIIISEKSKEKKKMSLLESDEQPTTNTNRNYLNKDNSNQPVDIE
jgi:hypothetical protein